MRRFATWAIIAAALLLAVIAGNFIYGWTAPGPLERETTVVIKPGSSITSAAQQLEKGGVVKSADAFVSRAKVFGASSTIKAGEFVVPAKASNSEILSILTGGKTVQRMVTIPEGMPSFAGRGFGRCFGSSFGDSLRGGAWGGLERLRGLLSRHKTTSESKTDTKKTQAPRIPARVTLQKQSCCR